MTDLTPGPEADARVAKAMGKATWHGLASIPESPVPIYYDNRWFESRLECRKYCEAIRPFRVGGRKVLAKPVQEIPAYTTSWEGMGLMLEWMVQRYAVALMSPSGVAKDWRCALWEGPPSNGGCNMAADTAPLAVAKALLAACEEAKP